MVLAGPLPCTTRQFKNLWRNSTDLWEYVIGLLEPTLWTRAPSLTLQTASGLMAPSFRTLWMARKSRVKAMLKTMQDTPLVGLILSTASGRAWTVLPFLTNQICLSLCMRHTWDLTHPASLTERNSRTCCYFPNRHLVTFLNSTHILDLLR